MGGLTGVAGRRSGRADAEVLRDCLERIVSERFGSSASIAAITRKRFPQIGSYDCETIGVQTRGGERLALFFKDFGFSRLSKDDREQRRLRELRVYRELLATADLGTPHYYASHFDETRGRYWLLLERVEGTVVEEADLELGVPAAAWLARLQAFFLRRSELLSACDLLIRHDEAFFRSKAEAASRDVAQLCPSSSGALDGLLARYDRAVESMTRQPRSLVHGGYIPWHVLVDTRREPPRVCAVDWELAAEGATLYDLALFSDGVAPRVRDGLLAAYRDAAVALGVPVPDRAEAGYVIDCFRLHRILDWLSRSAEKGFSARKVAKLVAQAQALAATLRA